MSWLKLFNLLFQLTGFRLAKSLRAGYFSWGLLGPVLPFTGWGSDYIGFFHNFFRITSWRMV